MARRKSNSEVAYQVWGVSPDPVSGTYELDDMKDEDASMADALATIKVLEPGSYVIREVVTRDMRRVDSKQSDKIELRIEDL